LYNVPSHPIDQTAKRGGELVVLPGEVIHKFIYVLTGKLQVNFLFSDGRERMVCFGGKHCMFNYLFQYNSDNTDCEIDLLIMRFSGKAC
jgi:CRP-like cAMP-binding protein